MAAGTDGEEAFEEGYGKTSELAGLGKFDRHSRSGWNPSSLRVEDPLTKRRRALEGQLRPEAVSRDCWWSAVRTTASSAAQNDSKQRPSLRRRRKATRDGHCILPSTSGEAKGA